MSFYLLINGPAKSGKSTLAREAIRHYQLRNVQAKPESYAGPMKNFIANLLGQAYSSVDKDNPCALLKGEHPRKFLIDLFNEHIKPRYGGDLYGRALAHRTKPLVGNTVYVLDDSGVIDEFDAIPRSLVCLVRLMRPGFESSDYRSYLPKPDRILVNDSTLDNACSKMRDIVEYSIIKWKLWIK